MYLDVDTGATGTSSFTGWDINPFFGGAGVGNSAAFHLVRVNTSNLDAVVNRAGGTVISGSLTYSSGFGGSGNPGHEHIGPAANQFQVGTESYLVFKFTKYGGPGPYNGWMRVTLTNNTGSAVIKDWGYDDACGAIVTGRVQQSAASGGAQLVTLSPATGETFTVGSAITNTGGNTNSLLKTGAGTTTLGASALGLGVPPRTTTVLLQSSGLRNGKLLLVNAVRSACRSGCRVEAALVEEVRATPATPSPPARAQRR